MLLIHFCSEIIPRPILPTELDKPTIESSRVPVFLSNPAEIDHSYFKLSLNFFASAKARTAFFIWCIAGRFWLGFGAF